MLDAIAIAILAGMMFVPIINIVVGIIVGAGLFGFSGACAGAAIAVLITLGDNRIRRAIQPTRAKPSAQILAFPGGFTSHRAPWPPAPAFEALLHVEDADHDAISAALRNLDVFLPQHSRCAHALLD